MDLVSVDRMKGDWMEDGHGIVVYGKQTKNHGITTKIKQTLYHDKSEYQSLDVIDTIEPYSLFFISPANSLNPINRDDIIPSPFVSIIKSPL